MASACRPARAPDDVAMLAHELRRRMAAVRVAGEAVALLRDQGRDIGAMLDLLLAEVGDLDALASGVLGDPAGRPAEAMPDVADTVQAAARTVAVARGASVRVQAGAPAEVEASPTMLRQAIENLIDNAAAHGGPDGIEVDVRPDQATGQVSRWWWPTAGRPPRTPAATASGCSWSAGSSRRPAAGRGLRPARAEAPSWGYACRCGRSRCVSRERC